jgi:hypothetical protein
LSSVARRRLAVALIVVATLTGFLTLTSLWVKRQVLVTDRWVETSGKLLEDEDIRTAVAQYLTDQLFASGDIQEKAAEVLPPRLAPLAGPLTGGLQTVTQRVAEELLQRPAVQDLWEEANRSAQQQLVALIEDEPVASEALGTVAGKAEGANLNLSEIRKQLSERLGIELPTNSAGQGPGQAALEAGSATAAIEILAPDELEAAQDVGGLLQHLPVILLLLTLALFAAAIYVARDSRRGVLMGCGLAFVLVGVLALTLRRVGGDAVVDALASSESVRPATLATWEIGTSLLHTMAWATIAYGIVAIVGGWLAGPSRPATTVRRFAAPFVREPVAAYGGFALAFIALIAWGPTPAFREALSLLIILVLLVLGFETLRRQMAREFPSKGN